MRTQRSAFKNWPRKPGGGGHTRLIPEFGRQRQVDLRETEASLVYTVSSRTVPKAPEKPCLEKQTDTIELVQNNTFKLKQRNSFPGD